MGGAMPYDGLRGFITAAQERGELRVLHGADWNLEIGALAALSHHKISEPPLLLFDNIKGYPEGYRVLVNTLSTTGRLNLSVGLPASGSKLETIELWRHKLADVPLIPPVFVDDGPVLENVHLGS